MIQNGERKTLKVGVESDQVKLKLDDFVRMFTMYPSRIEVTNNTKTCTVELLVKDNVFHITVKNPDDETFKL